MSSFSLIVFGQPLDLGLELDEGLTTEVIRSHASTVKLRKTGAPIMSRLAETPETLVSISIKAHEFIQKSKYIGPSSFTAGRAVISFEEQCRIITRLRLR